MENKMTLEKVLQIFQQATWFCRKFDPVVMNKCFQQNLLRIQIESVVFQSLFLLQNSLPRVSWNSKLLQRQTNIVSSFIFSSALMNARLIMGSSLLISLQTGNNCLLKKENVFSYFTASFTLGLSSSRLNSWSSGFITI